MSKPFPRDNHLTSIAIAYKNPEVNLIADQVLPRVKVSKREFSYYEYPEGQMYTVSDTRVGEHDRVNRSNVRGNKETSEVEDNGQIIPLTKNDIDQAPQGVDPKAQATERGTNIILLSHERNVCNLVTNPANYPATNTKNLAAGGNKRLDASDADPFGELLAGLDACLVRPNYLTFGAYAWRKLSTAPKVVAASQGNSGESGIALRRVIAELLEVNEIFVGRGVVNIAKPGKAIELAQLWGNVVLAHFRDSTVGTSGGITFGFTAQMGDRVAGSRDVPAGDMGLYGGVEVLSGESTKPLIVAPRAGFPWTNACTAA
ncbi:MAG TPA: hypothetical protein VN764_17335 [Polyangiaceae bacterium]|nr:hypothetical protein [Polyangiaceae bacterium]